jgi:hypothetical protein
LNKIVLYTTIIGNYDILKEVKFPEKNIDYLCFTDLNITSKTWKIMNTDDVKLNKDRKSRYYKIMPHLFLNDYEISIYVDGSINVIGNIEEFVYENLKDYDFYACKHPTRQCIYDEAKAIVCRKLDEPSIINSQIKKYKEYGFPANFGLTANGLLLRRHNSIECIKIQEQWWEEFLNNSKRDQMSLMYIFWKNPKFKFGTMEYKILCNNKYFKLNNHKKYIV